MTDLQALSKLEQMDAHRRDFLTWWKQNIQPHVPPDYTTQCLSRDQHWQAYRAKHHLNAK